MEASRERQFAAALESLLPALGEGESNALRSARRMLAVLASDGPLGLRDDATRLAQGSDKALRDGCDALARALRGRRDGASGAPILIIEDDDLVAAAIAIHLLPLGREVVEARDLASARRHLEDRVGAVVLDLQLGGQEDGRDLLAEWSGSVPIVVLSAIADRPAVQRECRALGARAVLPKPAMPDVLLETLSAVLADAPAAAPPEDMHLIALLRQRTHLTEADLDALVEGIDDLTWDAAVRTHLGACDECRDRHRRRLHER